MHVTHTNKINKYPLMITCMFVRAVKQMVTLVLQFKSMTVEINGQAATPTTIIYTAVVYPNVLPIHTCTSINQEVHQTGNRAR